MRPPDDNVLRIDPEELYTPDVDRYVAQEQAAARYGSAPTKEESRAASRMLLMSSLTYMTSAGLIAGFLSWLCIEPIFDDNSLDDSQIVAGFLLFAMTGAFVGLALSAAEGLMRRQVGPAVTTGLIGGAVGFGAGVASLFVAGIFFTIVLQAFSVRPNMPPMELIPIVMLARAPAWAVVGAGIGAGMGVARRSSQVALNGVIGGLVGGLLGGLSFDPVDLFFGTGFAEDGGEAWLSRLIGLMLVGGGIGFFVALVELISRRHWVEMLSGPLRGKQFVLYRFPTVIGSSPQADIYLFKDHEVRPEHARLVKVAASCEVQSMDDSVVVNGRVQRTGRLQDGDLIQIGQTRMKYGERKA